MFKFFKFILVSICFLDVAVFPFSCYNSNNRRNDYVIYEIIDASGNHLEQNEWRIGEYIEDETSGYTDAHIKNRYGNLATLSDWYLLLPDGSTKAISFPYEYQESDFHGYYRGYRHSIVIQAQLSVTVHAQN